MNQKLDDISKIVDFTSNAWDLTKQNSSGFGCRIPFIIIIIIIIIKLYI